MVQLSRSIFDIIFSSFLLQIPIVFLAFGRKESNSFSIHLVHHNCNRLHATKIKRIKMSTGTNDKTDAAIRGPELGGSIGNSESLPTFPNRIPDERLGTRHESLEAFYKASFGTTSPPANKTKEYTLIVVTETRQQMRKQQRILLGLKNRGFGTGKYNSFGGKFLHDEADGTGTKEKVEECACRELEEETNLRIPLETMKASKVGIQKFSFSDNDKEMLVHLFFLDLANRSDQQPYEIRACEEITPKWFESFDNVPLDNMFADDSLWLTTLLSRAASTKNSSVGPPLEINGSYHFAENCEETNTILHYYMDVRVPSKKSSSKSI